MIESAKQSLVEQIAARADLTEEQRSTACALGMAILESDFATVRRIVAGFAGAPEYFARTAAALAQELRCPEVAIQRVFVILWRASSCEPERNICVITFRLENARRLINVGTDAGYGVQVFTQIDPVTGKSSPVNEDPHLLLRKTGTLATMGPPPLSAAS